MPSSKAKAKPKAGLRRPGQKADPAQVDAFERRLAAREASAPGAQSTGGPVDQSTDEPPRGVVRRVRKGDLDRITAYLPLELGSRVRAYCAVNRIEMSEAIGHALEAWLAERGG